MRVREEEEKVEEENKTKLGYFGFNLLKFLFNIIKKNTYLISILLNTNSIMAYI